MIGRWSGVGITACRVTWYGYFLANASKIMESVSGVYEHQSQKTGLIVKRPSSDRSTYRKIANMTCNTTWVYYRWK